MKCHYEVMGVSRDINAEDLKKTYRQLALQCHPDKNPDNVEEATEKFREIQQAYEVLSDVQERAWYDKNRDAILRKDLAKEYEERNLDVFPYFTSSCYSGFSDGPKGFYTVYREVFEKIAAEDLDFVDKDDSDYEIPSFGQSDSSYMEVVHEFYAFWESYCTAKTYDWVAEYDARSGPNRRVQRLIEKENKKLKDQARKTRNEEVRQLVAFVRKRDKRVQVYRAMLQEKAAENARKVEENRLKQIENRVRQAQDYKESQWSSMASLESELKLLEKDVSSAFGDTNACLEEDSDEDAYDSLFCVVCDKYFRTEKSFANHEKSKKHKENVVLLKTTMHEEDKHFSKEAIEVDELQHETAPAEPIESDLSDPESFDEDTATSVGKKKQKKKRKNKSFLQPKGPEPDTPVVPIVESKDECETLTPESLQAAQPSQVKLKGKKAKDAKRKARLENEEVKPVEIKATPVKETVECDAQCEVCGNRFTTRNKLFDHLKKTGHAAIKNGVDHGSKKGEKKKKGKD